MADITLAEYGGSTWLVVGDDFIDDLLANTLPAGVTIELVACASKADVLAMWQRHAGEPGVVGDPWLIHPAIAARVRRGTSGHLVRFQPWSALLDPEALAVIATAVAAASAEPAATIELLLHDSADAPPMALEMARLRGRLIEEKLVETGLDRARIVPPTEPGIAESEAVRIVIRVA
jgi:hypothetical protein